ncbi:MAG: ATP12 family chaperone protein [Alphaproteobacteria bacterium]
MKRFWREVSVEAGGGGFAIRLDGRPLRTPAKAACLLPTRALARAVAAEWAAVEGEVDPAAMALTRAANSAIDRVIPEREAIAALIAAYGEADLICYRAPQPQGLARRQGEAWDPLLAWAAETLGAPLVSVEGVVHVAQLPESLARLGAAVRAHGPWELTALHDLVSISGSLVLGLAVSHGRLDAATAWPLSRIDEDWQVEEWGADDEAAAVAARRRANFADAARLLELVRA